MFPRGTTIIDPTRLSPEDAEILDQFLRAKKLKAYTPNTEYTFSFTKNGKRENLTIVLTHKIVSRPVPIHGSHQTEQRYSVYLAENPLGEGSYGKVFDVLGTLKHKKNGMQFDTHMPRVMKEIHDVTKNISEQTVRDEFTLSHQALHLHAKPGSIEDETGYLVLRKFKGEPLDQVLAKYTLTSNQRITLSIKLLYALKEQLHFHGIVHLDIKPENILIDISTFEIKIFDLGLSKKISSDTIHGRGTPGFLPPEAHGEFMPIDVRSDIFSMGITLALIWGYKLPNLPLMQMIALTKHDFNTLFLNISDMQYVNLTAIDTQHRDLEKNQIRNILERMTATRIVERYDIDTCLEQFNGIRLYRKTAALPFEQKDPIIKAYKVAKKTRDLLKRQNFSLEDLQKELHDALSSISDTPPAIQEFIETMDIKSYQGLTTLDELKDVTTNIINSFKSSMTILKDLLDDLIEKINILKLLNVDKTKLLEFDNLVAEIKYVLNKFEKRLAPSTDFDNLAEITRNKDVANAISELKDRTPKIIETIPSLLPTKPKIMIYEIMLQLTEKNATTADNTNLVLMKNKIKSEIREYITSFPDRASSEKRYKDMVDIIRIVEAADSENALITEIKARFISPEFKTGLFRDKSVLRAKVGDVLREFESAVMKQGIKSD